MAKPRIGITVDYVTGKPHYMLPWTYVEAVEKAGGLPVLLPYRVDPSNVPQYVDGVDGIVLAGGDDLDPSLYGEPLHLMAKQIDPDRQRFEMALLAEIERRAVPVLGVCLGSQLMNVYRGGALHQFLPDLTRDDPIEHRLLDNWGTRHAVRIEPQSILADAIGTTAVQSNTSHKQAVKTLGK
ncbi:MAG TPA: gamma-glutamyl-gamma-aminobutyrate hydrolase family protein, partial [Tepidisphaeraceae bacterium]